MRWNWALTASGTFGAVTICAGPAAAFFPPVPVDPPVQIVDRPPTPQPPVIVPPTVPPMVPPVSPPPFVPPPPTSPPPLVPPVVPPPPVVHPPVDCPPTPQQPQVVPEPMTVVSAGIGLAVVAGWTRRRKGNNPST